MMPAHPTPYVSPVYALEESLGCAGRHCGGRLGPREPQLSTPQALSSLVGLVCLATPCRTEAMSAEKDVKEVEEAKESRLVGRAVRSTGTCFCFGARVPPSGSAAATRAPVSAAPPMASSA